MLSLMAMILSGPAAAETCPVKFFGEPGTSAILWEDTVTGDIWWEGSSTFETTPWTVSDPETTWFTEDMVNYGSTPYAWGAAITVDGDLNTWGYGITTTTPSGEEPYSSPECGKTGKCVVLDNGGHVETFFNGSSGSFNSGRPTAGNFDGVAVGLDVGCSWDNDTATGVTCWGSNADNLVSNPDKPGSGYQIYDVAVGRYAAAAADIYGDTYCWHTSRSGFWASADEFCANRPLDGVERIEVNEYGELFGVAHMFDGTAVIWEWNDGVNTNESLTGAPGWDDYGTNGLNQFRPEGPDGYLTFRFIGLSIYDDHHVYAVIDDPKGLVEDGYAYQSGDAVEWDSYLGANVHAGCY